MKLKLLTILLVFTAVLTAHAQPGTNIDSASLYSTNGKLFNGTNQYRTWTVGANTGILSPFLVIGGTNNFSNANLKLGYGVNVRKQLGSVFGLQFDVIKGYISGSNRSKQNGMQDSITAFNTELAYSASLSGVFKLGTINYFRKRSSVSFFIQVGSGFAAYAPKLFYANGITWDSKGHNGKDDATGKKQYTHEIVTTAGVGAKFKMTDRVAINLGYNASFVDDDILDGVHSYTEGTSQYNTHKDKFSYGYAGLEFSIGKGAKQNIDWVNPAYEMRKDYTNQAPKGEYNSLYSRADSVERYMNELKKDADGDGVADYFDKCPNTPKGLMVDGSGCPIKINGVYLKASNGSYGADGPVDKGIIVNNNVNIGEGTINFDFNSPEIRNDSYDYLNSMASRIMENHKQKIQINGYASAEGTPGHNITLSIERANAIKKYLINAGVPAKQLFVKGYGETHPVADNSTEEGRAQNRRVEIKVK